MHERVLRLLNRVHGDQSILVVTGVAHQLAVLLLVLLCPRHPDQLIKRLTAVIHDWRKRAFWLYQRQAWHRCWRQLPR